jgi:hypothetical protein
MMDCRVVFAFSPGGAAVNSLSITNIFRPQVPGPMKQGSSVILDCESDRHIGIYSTGQELEKPWVLASGEPVP